MYQKLQTGRATAMAELLSDTIDNVNLNNVAVSSAATPGSGGTVLVDTSLDGAELITNGDFSATGGELVTNGDFSATGADLLTQPIDLTIDFDANSGGVIVDADTFTTAGGSLDGLLSKVSSWNLVSGKSYKLVIAGSTTSSGFTIGDGGGSGNEYGSGFGTHYFVSLGTRLWIRQLTAGTTDLTTFTIEELGADWTSYELGTSNVTFGENVAELNIDALNSNVGIYQENIFSVGKSYKIVLSMKATASFDAEILEANNASTESTIGTASLTTSYQDFTYYFTATGTFDLFIHRLFSASGASQTISIQSVSVKELGEGWTELDPTNTFGENGLTMTSTAAADVRIRTGGFLADTTLYKVTYTIHAVGLTGTNAIQYYTGSGLNQYEDLPEQGIGTHTFYYTTPISTNKNWYFRLDLRNSSTSTTDFVTISYISVEESANAGFTLLGVKVGDIVYNTASTPNVATVVGISPDGDTLTLSNDISVTSGVPYKILSRTNSAATLYIGTVGASATLKVRTAGGDDVTLDNLVQGTTLPTQVVRVYNTGTANVSNIIALF